MTELGTVARAAAALRPGLERLRAGWLAILQSAVGAGLAWFVAYDVIGHAQPFFAPIAAILALGVSLGQRLSRTLQLLTGVVLGVLVGDLLLQVIGPGAWQIMLFVGVAMATAVLCSGSQLTINQTAISAVLLATIASPDQAAGAGLNRFVDAAVGALIGLAINAVLLPVNPLTIVRRSAGPMFSELAAVLDDIADGLERGDRSAARSALERARALDAGLGILDGEISAAEELARLAPVRWSMRAEVQRYAAMVTYLDYTVRNTRVLARRAYVLVEADHAVVGELPAAIRHLATAVRLLHADVERDTSFAASRARIAAAAALAAEGLRHGRSSLSVQIALEQVRSTAVDLLRASGLTIAEARAALGGPPSPPMSTTDG